MKKYNVTFHHVDNKYDIELASAVSKTSARREVARFKREQEALGRKVTGFVNEGAASKVYDASEFVNENGELERRPAHFIWVEIVEA